MENIRDEEHKSSYADIVVAKETSLIRSYSKEGLCGIFIVNKKMDIRSFCINKEEYLRLMRYSILRLLAWMQRTVMLTVGICNIKKFFENGPIFDENIHKKLLNYYLNCKHLHIEDETDIIPDSRHSPYTTKNVVSNKIIVCGIAVYTFFVAISTVNGISYIPLVCLSDI